MATVTFISSFFFIYNSDYDEKKSVQWRLDRFREIAQTGIRLCLYVCPVFKDRVEEVAKDFENVRVMRVMSIDELYVITATELELPSNRNGDKDTSEYMAVINSKTEFMADTIAQNPWNTEYFAWIDFNISHVFRDKPSSLEYLRELGNRKFHGQFFAIPGCWDKFDRSYITHVTESIHWRFCGGFFIGDKESILQFDKLYKRHYHDFVDTHGKLVWEVNFWAWLESNTEWAPEWYLADHSDSIITHLSASYFALNLKALGSHETQYDYPHILMYHPGSASYLNFKGKHLLNTRYVNYWYYESGSYMFYDSLNTIRTINSFSELTDDGEIFPLSYANMSETDIGLQRYAHYARGLEDIRLYEHDGRVKFIATVVEYYHTGGNRMVTGNYDYQTLSYSDVRIIEPPTETQFEKNWIPLSPHDPRDLFIYKWAPLEIGAVTSNNNNKLEIVMSFNETVNLPFFKKMKGSSPFVPNVDENELIGVVHFSEDAKPRRYYHMMLVLDRRTFRPIRYSEPFVFEKPSIEFCIGFTREIEKDMYLFWISRFDRDPLLITIQSSCIEFADIDIHP